MPPLVSFLSNPLPAADWWASGAFGGEHCCVGSAEQAHGVMGVGWEGRPARLRLDVVTRSRLRDNPRVASESPGCLGVRSDARGVPRRWLAPNVLPPAVRGTEQSPEVRSTDACGYASRSVSSIPPARRDARAHAARTPRPGQGAMGWEWRLVVAWIASPAVVGADLFEVSPPGWVVDKLCRYGC
jgi:hypothetical protein